MNDIQRKAQLITEILHDLKIPLNKVDDALSAACLILSAPEGSIIIARHMQSIGITTTNEAAVEEMDAVVLEVKDMIDKLPVPEPNAIPKSKEGVDGDVGWLIKALGLSMQETIIKLRELSENDTD